MRSVIFAGGIVQPSRAVDRAIAGAELLIAADSGAATALHYGKVPDAVVGDFDSLDPAVLEHLRAQSCPFIPAPVEKDETDTELAVHVALERGATEITLLGALGGARFDHTIANILLLAGVENVPIRIIDGPTACWLLRGPGSTPIEGDIGDLLSLFPLTGAATGVYTDGLYYPLAGETLFFGKPRGVSNVLTQEHATVSLEGGTLLVIHTSIQEPKQS